MPKKVDKEAKKDKILRSAMTVFAKNGIAETKMEMVAMKAGIAKGTIYEYFKSKEELLQMVFNYVLVQMNLHVKQSMAAATTPEEKLKAGVSAYIDIESLGLSDASGLIPELWSYGIRLRESKAEIPFDLRWIYIQYRELFGAPLREGIEKGFFKQDIDVKAIAASIVAAADGFYLQWMSDKKNFDMKKNGEIYISVLLNGIRKE